MERDMGKATWGFLATLLGVVVGVPFYLLGFLLGSIAGCFYWGFRKTWNLWRAA